MHAQIFCTAAAAPAIGPARLQAGVQQLSQQPVVTPVRAAWHGRSMCCPRAQWHGHCGAHPVAQGLGQLV